MKRTAVEREQFVAARAAAMRAAPTVCEERTAEILKALNFQPQWHVTGRTKNGGEWYYILDFYHEKLRICVEIDGSSHRKRKGRDRRRDARLLHEGIITLRFKNSDVLKRPDWILETVQEAMR